MRNDLQQVELHRVLGRYLTEKLIKTGWITPVRKDANEQIWFDQRAVHRAIKRLRRSNGLELDGHARRPIVTPARAKRCGELADLAIDLEAELRQFEERETKTPFGLD